MPTSDFPGGDSPAITSYLSPGSNFYIYSTFTSPTGRAMANGSRSTYIQSFGLYVAGRTGSTKLRAYFNTTPRGSYVSYGAQGTPSKKNLVVNALTPAGNTYRYGVYWEGGQGGVNFRRASSGTGGSTQSSGSSSWDTPLSGTYTYAEAPEAPTVGAATSITQSGFTVPFSSNGNGGSAFTGHVLQYDSSSNFSSPVTVAVSGNKTVTGLQPNTTYYYRGASRNIVTNEAGTYGPWSSARSVKTAAGTPSAPRNSKLVNQGGTSVKLTWSAPSSNGGSSVTGYKIWRSQKKDFSSGVTGVDVGNVLTWTSPALGTGTWYFKIRAYNANGDGTWGPILSNTITRLGHPSVFDGVDWNKYPMKVYLSGTWQEKPVKAYVGGKWVVLL